MEYDSLYDLVRAAKEGDRDAYGQLIRESAGLVTGVAYAVLGDFAQSEDVAQEAYFEAWRSLNTLQSNHKFKAWICTIARRRAVDFMRTRRTPQLLPTELVAVDSSQTPEEVMSDAQDRQLVWSVLESLPDNYREAMVLYYRAEKSIEQVAEALEINTAAVRQRLKRGRDLLRDEVLEKLSTKLRSTVPTASFAAAIVAGLPSVSTATSIGAASLVGVKTASGSTASTAPAVLSGAVLGPLIGIAGGAFGAFMSWRNADYRSQQQFVIRQSIIYVIGLAIFLFAIMTFRIAVSQHWLQGSSIAYVIILILVIFQIWSLSWIWRGIRNYKRVTTEAERTGEARLPRAQIRHHELESQAVVRSDGSIEYEVFRWHAPGWFGSLFGGTAWMLLVGMRLIANGAMTAGVIAVVCCVTLWCIGIRLWIRRENWRNFSALKSLIVSLSIATAIVFAGIEFLATPIQKEAVQWSPWCWILLLLFPAILLRFSFMQKQRTSQHLNRGR